jgi:predicted HAD superfamily Cof-like phosphohydrolase
MNVSERQLLVREFCRLMGFPTLDVPGKPVGTLADMFLHKLREEVNELCVAAGQGGDPMSFIKLVDALRDTEYLLYGIELLFGVQAASDDSFMEVHWSNMTKTCDHGVVIKPTNFCKPDIVKVLRRHFPKQGLLFRS